MSHEPRAGRLVAWGNALLAGATSPDEAVAAITGGDEPHRVVVDESVTGREWPGGSAREEGPMALSIALGRLRAAGVTGLMLALPSPGHPLGLTGPPEFNRRALEAGQAVLAVGGPAVGLVPEVTVHGPGAAGAEGAFAASGTAAVPAGPDRAVRVLWRLLPVRPGFPASVPSLREAQRRINGALHEATERLGALDVASVGGAAEAVAELRDAFRGVSGAPGYPPEAVRLLELSLRLEATAELALRVESAAVNAAEAAERERILLPLRSIAREGQVAAYNAPVEERARRG
ncbi:hypothetical protein [Allostreptomyces psammosilenae]|uniref:Uncharacterized protein n=1 Tax=Allostreptomyces psammosilenae TaxID=1892865 RepID=A0A852ZPD5_9ACTN|nr:hypothetical protein [Allostreptomyces psammosilenae]NYI03337.1 hypothetical protein [Allostreptomyces psammosilenae]